MSRPPFALHALILAPFLAAACGSSDSKKANPAPDGGPGGSTSGSGGRAASGGTPSGGAASGGSAQAGGAGPGAGGVAGAGGADSGAGGAPEAGAGGADAGVAPDAQEASVPDAATPDSSGDACIREACCGDGEPPCEPGWDVSCGSSGVSCCDPVLGISRGCAYGGGDLDWSADVCVDSCTGQSFGTAACTCLGDQDPSCSSDWQSSCTEGSKVYCSDRAAGYRLSCEIFNTYSTVIDVECVCDPDAVIPG